MEQPVSLPQSQDGALPIFEPITVAVEELHADWPRAVPCGTGIHQNPLDQEGREAVLQRAAPRQNRTHILRKMSLNSTRAYFMSLHASCVLSLLILMDRPLFMPTVHMR